MLEYWVNSPIPFLTDFKQDWEHRLQRYCLWPSRTYQVSDPES